MNRRHIAILVCSLVFTGSAVAQRRYDDRPRDRDRDRRGPDLSRVIADCERRTDIFHRSLRRALDHRGYRGPMRQDDLNRHASALERSMNAVREAWNRERDPGRTRRFVSDAINVSREINHVMNRNRFHPSLHEQWNAVRAELNHLASAFGLPPLRWN